MKAKNKKRGFLSLEIILFLIVIAIMTPIAMRLMKSSENSNKVEVTKVRIKALSEAIERVFTENADYAQNNCYGWGDVACSSLTLTPTVKNINTLSFNTLDSLAVQTLIAVGCNVSGTAPNYDVKCFDGYGKLMKFNGLNLHSKGSIFTTPYTNNYPQLTINSTNAVPAIISIAKSVTNAKTVTAQKLNTIASGIKNYVRGKRIAELGNTCGTANTATNPTGGLDSTDDAIVPYVWQLFSVSPTTLCSGVENTTSNCGCTSMTNSNNWETSNAFCVINSNLEMNRLLTNLGLGSKYRTDGFGNILTIVPLSNSTGSATTCPPPRPTPEYTGLTSIPKTRIGIEDSAGQWADYIDVFSE